jgi:hypothetical protein
VAEFEEGGWQNVKVVIPFQAVFSSQVMFYSEPKAQAQPDKVLLLLAQLACSGFRSELNLAFQIFGSGRLGMGESDADPDEAAKVSDVGHNGPKELSPLIVPIV